MYIKFKKSKQADEPLDIKNEEDTRVVMIDILSIRPNCAQPRKYFDDNGIIRLADSIKRFGIIHPLTVRRADSVPKASDGEDHMDNYKYELISGERRLRAAMMLGCSKVPCIIKQVSGLESAEIAVIENLLRHDLNIFEQAEAFSALITKFGLTQAQVAEKLSTGQSSVANKLRLLRLSTEERSIILENRLTERHARALVRINDCELRREVLEQIISRKLNVSSTELLVERLLNPPAESGSEGEKQVAEHKFESAEDVFESFKRCFNRLGIKNGVECLKADETEQCYTLTVKVMK